MSRHGRTSGRFRGGFTLIETMLVVAVLAILISLALPSYQGIVRRAHRSEAIGQLLEIAACQERVRAGRGVYDTTTCLPPGNDRYDYRYLAGEETDPAYFRAAAQPRGAQAGDGCGVLSYDSLGQRLAADGDPLRCWSAR